MFKAHDKATARKLVDLNLVQNKALRLLFPSKQMTRRNGHESSFSSKPFLIYCTVIISVTVRE